MRGITDQYLPPIIVEANKQIKNNDVVLWTNYESISSYQILLALSNPKEVSEFETLNVDNLNLIVMYPVDSKIEATALINKESDMSNSLGNYLGKLGLSQARIALKSAYDYVTYYFNGESDEKIPKCTNYLVEVPKVDTDRPRELALAALTKQVIKCMEKDTDFILVSLDLADVIAHEGDFDGTIRSLEFIDECLGRIIESGSLNFYTIILTSTHGNVEEMLREEDKMSTVNTSNKVPFIITDPKLSLQEGALTDVAPTILSYMDISIPESMSGKVLIKE